MSEIEIPLTAVTSSKRELAKGAGIALAIATVVLTTAVLPAEYGIDPTRIGGLLGLTALRGAESTDVAPAPQPVATSPSGTLAAAQKPAYRVDTKRIILPPGEGLEIKTRLEKGAALIYSWKTDGGVVNHDFHGEPADAKGDEFESFIREGGVSESRGVLIAPFSGTHGWYWGNKTDAPVVVTLEASGFYTEVIEK